MIKFNEYLNDLASVPAENQSRFLYDSLKDKKMLHIFGKYFFPHIIRGESEAPECHLDLIRHLSSPIAEAIIFPRSFSKSTWEKMDILHDIVYAIEPVILWIGNTITDAQLQFESMKAELENNQVLVNVYGNLVPEDREKGKKWTNKHFETTNDINVVARGAGKGRGVNIKNQRPTKIVSDDVEDDEMVSSPERREKFKNWIEFVIIPSLDPERGRIKIIGTVIHQACYVLRFYRAHGGIFRKAIENGQSIWPGMFPLEKLNKIKNKYGTRMFNQEYMNNPINDEDSIIKPIWIERAQYSTLPVFKGIMYKVIMMDPQAGETKTADFYGLVVAGKVRGDKHKYILSSRTGRGTQLDQARLLIQTWQNEEHVQIVGVEKVMTQVAVYQLVLDWKSGTIEINGVDPKKRNIPIRAVEPQGKDKVARMQEVEPEFERGEIHLHAMMNGLRENLTAFPNAEHDDECFVSGTKITTLFGDKNIEEIKEGDYILTPFGLKKVLKSKCTGKKIVIRNICLTGTANHQIFSIKKGFAKLDAIMYNDVELISLYSLIKWRLKKLYISEVLNINLWGRESIIYRNQQLMKVENSLKDYILLFGNFIISEKSPKVLIFIIKMVIHLIMILLIWSVWKVVNIYQNIIKKIGKMKNTEKEGLKISTISDISLKSGTPQKKAMNGTKNMQKSLYLMLNKKSTNALSVVKNIKTEGLIPKYALRNVTKRKEEKAGLIILKKIVLYVKRIFGVINTQEVKHAQRVAHRNIHIYKEKRKVYNLTVEDGVYYANGILVSNCDALMYCLEYLDNIACVSSYQETLESYKTVTGNIEKENF